MMSLTRKSLSNREPFHPSLEQLEDRRTLSYTALISEIASYQKPGSELFSLPPIVESAFGEDGEILRVERHLSENKLAITVSKDGDKRDLTPIVNTPVSLVNVDLLPDGRAIGLDVSDQFYPVVWTSGSQPTKVPFSVPLAASLTQFSREVAFTGEGIVYSLVTASFKNPNRSQICWVTSDGKFVPTNDFSNLQSVRVIGVTPDGEPLVVIDSVEDDSSKEIRLYSSSLTSYQTIAQAGEEFSKLYATTMSKDGKLAAFIAVTQNNQKAAIYFTSLSTISPKRVLGEYGDEILDPTERWVDLSSLPDLPPDVSTSVDVNSGAFRDQGNLQRKSILIGSVQEKDGRSTFNIAYLSGQGLGNNKLLLTCEIQLDDRQPDSFEFEVGTPSILINSDETEVKLNNNTQKVSVNTVYDLDKEGNLLVLLDQEDESRSLTKLEPARRPIVIVPGIVGSFVGTDLLGWVQHVGIEPNRLSIDPITFAYDSMYQSLLDAGYELNRDLFLATYDWRLPPAPLDGTNDGIVSLINPESAIKHQQYGVDYLIYWLMKAAQSWQTEYPDFELDSVDIIAHSTGGLITRSYAQSPAYGAQLITANVRLPKINNFVMVSVPQEGAPKAASFLDDNWMVDPGEPTYRLFLRAIANTAFQKLIAGNHISFPNQHLDVHYYLRDLLSGTAYTEEQFKLKVGSSKYDPTIAAIKKKFIDKYISQIRGLAATYNYLRVGNSIISPTSFDSGRLVNVYLQDLNARPDWMTDGEDFLYSFPVVAHGNGVDTIVALDPKVGDGSSADLLKSIDELAAFPESGQNYLKLQSSQCAMATSLVASNNYLHTHPFDCGDGTVPRVSLISRFGQDPRVKHVELMTNISQFPESSIPKHVEVINGAVDHIGILSNPEFVSRMAGWVGSPIFKDQVAPKPWGAGVQKDLVGIVDYLILSIDPVYAVLVDEDGSRTGYTQAGVLQEIPNSTYIGDQDGILVAVDNSGKKQWRLDLTGDGGNYYIDVDGQIGGKAMGFHLSGELEIGQVLSVNLETPPEGDQPFAVGESVQLFEGQRVTVPVLANDWISPSGLPIQSIQLVDAPNSSRISIDQATGIIVVTAGTSDDQFSYRVTDALGRVSNAATVRIGVKLNNATPPIAVSDKIVVTSDDPVVRVGILENDSNLGGPLSSLSVQFDSPSNQAFVLNSDLTMSFSASQAMSGFSTARYSVTNSTGLQSNLASVQAFVVNYALARPWNNTSLAFDVNGDGLITPSDALLIINFLNSDQDRLLPSAGPTSVFGFLDVVADARINPSDALAVINWLNSPRSEGGEGEYSDLLFSSRLRNNAVSVDISLAQMFLADDNQVSQASVSISNGNHEFSQRQFRIPAKRRRTSPAAETSDPPAPAFIER